MSKWFNEEKPTPSSLSTDKLLSHLRVVYLFKIIPKFQKTLHRIES